MSGSRGGPGGPMNHRGGGGGAAERSAPTVADVVERVVGRFDGDGDDVVTLEELLAVLDPDGTRTTAAEKAAAARAAVDTDGSGGMSAAELTAAVTALDTDGDGRLEREDRSAGSDASALAVLLQGRGAHAVAATPEALTDRVFVRFDADDSGAITLAELVTALDAQGRSTAEAEAEAAAVMALADSGGDQQLGRDEVLAVIAAADADADGLVQWAEFVALPDELTALVGVHHGAC